MLGRYVKQGTNKEKVWEHGAILEMNWDSRNGNPQSWAAK